ncbi:MAG: hypothetical protein H6671_00390 [Anaerolineaceae bacterium]|nr:hypothetical protein [Anaerolineaceae bacterium]
MALRLPTFTHSAIMYAECRFQERNAAQPGRLRRWLGRGVMNLTLVISLVLFGGEIAGALLYRDPTPISDAFGPLTAFAAAVVMTLHFVLMFQTLSLSANSIAREKLKQTWEVLILTGIDARTVVLGKWWATVRRMGRQYLLLGLLRACIIGWVGAATTRSLYAYYASAYGGVNRITPPGLSYFLLLVLVVMVFTLANLGFTAACGVAASAQSRQPVMALIRAFAIRTGFLVGTSLALGLLVAQFQIYFFVAGVNGELFGVLPLVVVGLVDNGATSAMTLVSYGTPGVQAGAILLMVLMTLALYGGLTWFMLRQAEKQAVKHQALRRPRAMSVSGLRRHVLPGQ